MPPTALSIRFFSLPFVTLLWLKELLKLRNHIFAKKEIVSKIKIGKKEIEQDPVKEKLAGLIDRHTNLKGLFLGERCRINLVLNQEGLSISEAHRIIRKLSELGMSASRIIVNKVIDGVLDDRIRRDFNGYPFRVYPHHTDELYGVSALEEYLRENIRETVSGSDAGSSRNRVKPSGTINALEAEGLV